MLNQVVLVGKLTKNVEVALTSNGKSIAKIVLEIASPFKNTEGVYDKDYVPVTLWAGVAEHTARHCKEGSIIGVKGRLQVVQGELKVTAERVTFISGTDITGETE